MITRKSVCTYFIALLIFEHKCEIEQLKFFVEIDFQDKRGLFYV